MVQSNVIWAYVLLVVWRYTHKEVYSFIYTDFIF